MTLRELLSHFTNKTTWVDLCTPLWRKCGELRHIESEVSDAVLDLKVDSWIFTNFLIINM